jgi:methylated-DNA-[protein]-cysteine S-methyltransferase
MNETVLGTPIGGLGVFADGEAISGVTFGARLIESPERPDGVLATALAQLTEYFAGERTEFDVPTVLTRGSDFERAVWAQIATIPYGETRTYGSIAHAVGEPGGAQAVGTACNRNPLPVIVPCHRVIGANGKLVGFGGGLKRKVWLLQLEARVSIDRGVLLQRPSRKDGPHEGRPTGRKAHRKEGSETDDPHQEGPGGDRVSRY